MTNRERKRGQRRQRKGSPAFNENRNTSRFGRYRGRRFICNRGRNRLTLMKNIRNHRYQTLYIRVYVIIGVRNLLRLNFLKVFNSTTIM